MISAVASSSTALKASGAFTTGKQPRRQRLQVACFASRDAQLDRRQALLGLGAAVAAPLLATQPALADSKIPVAQRVIPVESLTAFQKADMIADFVNRACAELGKVLTTADAPAVLRLMLHDAATYDASVRGSPGMDGSIVLPEELDRPENRDLKPVVEKLAKAKAAIDAQGAERGQQPISWADTIVLGAKVATEARWAEERQARATTPEGKKNALMFPNRINVRVGRVDATQPAAGRVPGPDASIEEVRAFYNKLGNKPGSTEGPLAKLPKFNERVQFLLWASSQPDPAAAEERLAASDKVYADWKRKYDTSRRTVTRSEYEVDFGEKFVLTADLGAKFDKLAYLYPLKFSVPIKL